MKVKNLLSVLVVLTLASTVRAQTKISGEAECGSVKMDQMLIHEVGDHPNHRLALLQGTCSWSKPMQIAGMDAKEHVLTLSADSRADKVESRAYAVGTMESGDKFSMQFQGATTIQDGVPQGEEGTWNFTGGTGKLEGPQGGGTYKAKKGPEGGPLYEFEGEYQLPAG